MSLFKMGPVKSISEYRDLTEKFWEAHVAGNKKAVNRINDELSAAYKQFSPAMQDEVMKISHTEIIEKIRSSNGTSQNTQLPRGLRR